MIAIRAGHANAADLPALQIHLDAIDAAIEDEIALENEEDE